MEKQPKNITPPPQNFPVDYGTDPSALTTQQLWREIAALKELLEQRVEAVEKGIDVAHKDKERVPTEIQSAVGSTQILLEYKIAGVKELMETKIHYESEIARLRRENIEKQLSWMEVMRVEQKNDIKDAADKSEKAASKQVDQLADLVNRGLGNLNDKIGDQKDRLTNSDSTSKGKTLGIAQVISVVVAVATIVGIIVGMVMKYLAATGK